MSGAGKKVADVAVKAAKGIDWDGMAKLIVSEEARKEFFNLRRAFDEVNSTLQTKFSMEQEPIDWEYYRKGIGSRLVDAYKDAYESMSSSVNEVDPANMDKDNEAIEVSELSPNNKEKKRKKSEKSNAWDHFTKIEGSIPLKASCNYCKTPIACDPKTNGTSAMNSHMNIRCKSSLNPIRAQEGHSKQKTLTFKPNEGGGQDLVPVVFSQEECKKALTQMIILDELPFRFVEGEGFLNFCRVGIPRFRVPSRVSVARHCISMYLDEKKKLRSLLKDQRICITTDTWTSLQNTNYMVLTAHYVDKEWKLKKKILNFCVIPDHRGETIGKMVEQCLIEWDIGGIMTMTCDNASSNNVAIAWLKKKTKHWKDVVLGHEFIHVRCSAHVLNLVVKNGIKMFDESIYRVREAVRYVRASPARWKLWKKCIKDEKIASKKNVCLDVDTRWNATYIMLATAVNFENAFTRLEEIDDGFLRHFEKPRKRRVEVEDEDEDEEVEEGEDEDEDGESTKTKKYYGTPKKNDWDRARMFVKFLEIFFKTTKKISGSNYVTSDLLFNELVIVMSNIKNLLKNVDVSLLDMGHNMVNRFDKYWDLTKINPILLVAVVLDPRFKLDYIGFTLMGFYDNTIIESIKVRVQDALVRMYGWHVERNRDLNMASQNESQSMVEGDDMVMDPASRWKMHNKKRALGSKSGIDKYLASPLEEESNDGPFEILVWWKNNTAKYPLLSLVARDVLAIPVTSVASECAFSTEGRAIDSFRTSLRALTVEALICTQSWLRMGVKPLDLQASLEEIEEYDEIDAEMLNEAVSSSSDNMHS